VWRGLAVCGPIRFLIPGGEEPPIRAEVLAVF
jgi:hypothetical protein